MKQVSFPRFPQGPKTEAGFPHISFHISTKSRGYRGRAIFQLFDTVCQVRTPLRRDKGARDRGTALGCIPVDIGYLCDSLYMNCLRPGRLDGAFAPGPAGAGRDIRAGEGEEPLTACGFLGPHSYRALMLARMSLMTSEISGVVFLSFSIRSMEWSTVVWSRFSNSLPISLRERLVISRMR